MRRSNLSLVIPVNNEAPILESKLKIIQDYLSLHPMIDQFEILVVNNGSNDSSEEILNRMLKTYSQIYAENIPDRSLAEAIKAGLKKARYSPIMLMSIDISFGLKIIEKSLTEYLDGSDIVLGSKGHKDSVYKAPPKRVVFSKIYNFLVRYLFNINVKDTQGTFIINKNLIDIYLDNLVSLNGAWIQTQIVIYGSALGAKVKEIPVTYNAGNRKSKLRTSDAIATLKNLFKEYLIYLRWKKRIPNDIHF